MTTPATQADRDAEAAFDRHIVETIGWTKFASMQTAASGGEYSRAFKAGYRAALTLSAPDHKHPEIGTGLPPLSATPSALSGDAGEGEPWPGCYADLQQRRVATLAKLGLMLSVMAGGEAAEVVGYDAAELYADVLMALAIEDAEDTDIALEEARDHPDGDILAALPSHKGAGE